MWELLYKSIYIIETSNEFNWQMNNEKRYLLKCN